jgi:hypothetical protein
VTEEKPLRGVANVLNERARRLEETAARYRKLAEKPKSDEAKSACFEREIAMPKLDRRCTTVAGWPQCMGAAAFGPDRCTCNDAPSLRFL